MGARDLFGTDGVRGIAGEYPLDSDGAHRIGMAVGTLFAQAGQQIVIASDPRQSSAQLVADLTSGLTAVGVNVVSVGVMPTPGLAYLTRENDDYVAGVMVTASHNPVEYNGVKVFDANGDKLSDETESELNNFIKNGVPERGDGTSSTDDKQIQKYEDFLVNSADGMQLNGLTVAVDCANGAASSLAEKVFTRLGAQVTPLFDKPDGLNINAGCGATDTEALQQEVLAKGLSLGVALDGDADRVILVDGKGREAKGDYMLYVLAVAANLQGVVATIMSNQGFESSLTKRGIKLVRTAVGDRYVLEGLAETGYKLGGEQAGHIILPELLKTGDGLLAAVQTVKALSSSGRSLADWCDEVDLLPQALVNIPLRDKSLIENPAVKAFIEEQNNRLQGGRMLIRPSGTEPLARVMVETPNAQVVAEQIAAELQELLATLPVESAAV